VPSPVSCRCRDGVEDGRMRRDGVEGGKPTKPRRSSRAGERRTAMSRRAAWLTTPGWVRACARGSVALAVESAVEDGRGRAEGAR
jgi:hypothetical protein